MKQIIVILLLLSASGTFGQHIAGRIFDEKKEPAVSVLVSVYKGMKKVASTVTDMDGNYLVKGLDTGRYTVVAYHTGYHSVRMQGVRVATERTASVNFRLSVRATNTPLRTIVLAYTTPEEVRHLPPYSQPDLPSITTTPPPYYRGHGDISFGGPRTAGTQYIIDGVVYDSTKPAEHIDWKQEYIVCKERCTYKMMPQVLTLSRFPTTDVRDIASLEPLIYQARRGDDIRIGGSRTSGVGYIVDGARIMDAQPEHHLNIR